MRKYDFLSSVDFDSIEKKAMEKEGAIKELESKKAEVQKKAEGMSAKILEAYEGFKKAQICQDRDTPALFEVYKKALGDKNWLVNSLYQKTESLRSELCAMLGPLKESAIDAITRELETVNKKYVCESVIARTNLAGRILDNFVRDIDSGKKTMDIRSNGKAILEARTILIPAKGRIAQAQTLTGLKTVLMEISTELSKIDLEAQDLNVSIDDYENLSKSHPFEVGFLIQGTGKPIVIKPENVRQSRSVFDSDGRLLSNPW